MTYNILSVSDFGTLNKNGVSAAENTVIFQAAYDALGSGKAIGVSAGSYAINNITGSKSVLWKLDGALNSSNNGFPPLQGINIGLFDKRYMIEKNKGATDSDLCTLQVTRRANYNGGNSSFVNNALYAASIVSAGVTNFEWASLAYIENNATGGQNLASYHQAKKLGDGPTWASTFELQDNITNPATGSVVIESGLYANGTDANGARVVSDLVIGKLSSAGTAPTVQHFIRCGNSFDDVNEGNVNIAHYTKSNINDTVYKAWNTKTLASAANSTMTFVDYSQTVGANNSHFIVDHIRAQNGPNWDTSNMRFYRSVDGTIMGAVEFRNLTDLTFNRSIALTMGGADFFEANLLRNMSVFKNPINLVPQSANPTNGVPNSFFDARPNNGEANFYIKGGKFVIQYNNGGTLRYTTFSLTTTGNVTVSGSTTAP